MFIMKRFIIQNVIARYMAITNMREQSCLTFEKFYYNVYYESDMNDFFFWFFSAYHWLKNWIVLRIHFVDGYDLQINVNVTKQRVQAPNVIHIKIKLCVLVHVTFVCPEIPMTPLTAGLFLMKDKMHASVREILSIVHPHQSVSI